VPSDRRPLDAFIGDLASLHERYGGDVKRLVAATRDRLAELVRQPSINETFDDLPVRELAGASRQAWRSR
jgi:hypothetical protein